MNVQTSLISRTKLPTDLKRVHVFGKDDYVHGHNTLCRWGGVGTGLFASAASFLAHAPGDGVKWCGVAAGEPSACLSSLAAMFVSQ